MAKTPEEIERNVSASFGYVKKDILMLNDAVSDIQDKIQHLSLNHAALLEKIGKIEGKKKISKKKVGKKKVGKISKAKPKKVVREKAVY